jgi:protein arginine N-methyltransferase 2
VPVEHEPCTKPDYLDRNVRYNTDQTALLDEDDDAVMMEWERPLMEAHASILTSNDEGKRVLNVGFGMGIIDTALQKRQPSLHIIIEAHPQVYAKMLHDKWDQKPNVRICFGKWQTVLPQLIQEGVTLDGIFYDTYGEHFTDLEDFHDGMVQLLAKPHGIYSFFNGLAPDNIFFHGVGTYTCTFFIGG